MIKDNYCPIRYRTLFRRNLCRATGEKCDEGLRENCVERIRRYFPKAHKEKFETWVSHRRGEKRGGKLQ